MTAEKLDNLSLLKITGDDAHTFLQGQLTNDINLTDKEWQYSGYCTPKGRLLALFTLWQTEEGIYALLDKSLVESTVKRLRMYIMRSKVVIEELESQCYGVFDVGNENLVTAHFSAQELSKLDKYSFVSQDHAHCLSFGERHLIVLENSLELINSPEPEKQKWLNQNIQEGLPQVNAHSAELFIPQMLNLDVLKGINFKKGCYTGQEIVARMHYLGKLKQRMFVCSLELNNDSNESDTIKSGDKIYSDELMTKTAGHIVSINAKSALAVLRLDDVEKANEQNLSFTVNELTSLNVEKKQPYSLEIK